MAQICPTVLAHNAHIYRTQIERIDQFAERIQIDLTDGIFAPRATVLPRQVWWPDNIFADIHLMYQRPMAELSQLVRLHPSMVIIHAEAEGNFIDAADILRNEQIRVGVALLPKTDIEAIAPALDYIDHVLIFAGNLGNFGGEADMSMTQKIAPLKKMKPTLEIGWDGGVNDKNVRELAEVGVDVLNVGSFIQRAVSPNKAYARLEELIGSKT